MRSFEIILAVSPGPLWDVRGPEANEKVEALKNYCWLSVWGPQTLKHWLLWGPLDLETLRQYALCLLSMALAVSWVWFCGCCQQLPPKISAKVSSFQNFSCCICACSDAGWLKSASELLPYFSCITIEERNSLQIQYQWPSLHIYHYLYASESNSLIVSFKIWFLGRTFFLNLLFVQMESE